MDEEIWNEIYRLGERIRILLVLKDHYRDTPPLQKKLSKKIGDLSSKSGALLRQLS